MEVKNDFTIRIHKLEAEEDSTPLKNVTRLKKLYEEARKNIPSIIFIDELDEIVTSREFMSDSSRVMVKTLLSEIDGVKSSEGILTIATTNYYNRLPSSLKRSGRMDKHISFNLPDLKSREEILQLYLKNKDIAKNIDVKMIAKKTNEFSCADLKTLVNETLLNAISNNKKEVNTSDFIDAIPIIAFKGIKNIDINELPSDRVCYHELGHFICEYILNGNISSVSVEKVGDIAGHIRKEMEYFNKYNDNQETFTKLKKSSIVLLGGYCAEKIFTGEVSSGVVNDLQKFGNSIQYMGYCGMFGAEYAYSLKSNFVDSDKGYNNENESSNSNNDIRVKCFKEYESIATKIINDNKPLIKYLFKELKKNRKLESEEVKELLDQYQNIK